MNLNRANGYTWVLAGDSLAHNTDRSRDMQQIIGALKIIAHQVILCANIQYVTITTYVGLILNLVD